MKQHLGIDDGSGKTLCGQPAGFIIPGTEHAQVTDETCARCAREKKQIEGAPVGPQ